MHPLPLKYREESFEFFDVTESTLQTQHAELALLYTLSLSQTNKINIQGKIGTQQYGHSDIRDK
jgi:hypothetical protein